MYKITQAQQVAEYIDKHGPTLGSTIRDAIGVRKELSSKLFNKAIREGLISKYSVIGLTARGQTRPLVYYRRATDHDLRPVDMSDIRQVKAAAGMFKIPKGFPYHNPFCL